MPGEVLHFFVNLLEVVAALAALIGAGLLITLAGLWIVPKIFGVTPETLEDADSDWDEEAL